MTKSAFWKNKEVLITGAAGFIGSNLSKSLLEEGCQLILVDNLERGKLEYIEDILGDVDFVQSDLRIPQNCDAACTGVDIVIHLASKVGGIDYYLSKPYEVMRDNMMIDSNILNSVVKNDITRYFYASSAHLYPRQLQTIPKSPLIYEDDVVPADPHLSYGWAKLFAEKQIEYACVENRDLRVAIARYIGIYGENQDFDLKTGSAIPVFCNRAISYGKIPFSIWGTGEETRSYCFIDDAVECTKIMIETLDNKSFVGPYNVGKQERFTIREIAEKIIEISNKSIEIEYDKTKETKIWGQICDVGKIEKELGWRASTSLENGLRRIYADIERRI